MLEKIKTTFETCSKNQCPLDCGNYNLCQMLARGGRTSKQLKEDLEKTRREILLGQADTFSGDNADGHNTEE